MSNFPQCSRKVIKKKDTYNFYLYSKWKKKFYDAELNFQRMRTVFEKLFKITKSLLISVHNQFNFSRAIRIQ